MREQKHYRRKMAITKPAVSERHDFFVCWIKRFGEKPFFGAPIDELEQPNL